MKSALVFCGASKGNELVYAQTARELGKLLVKKKIRVVYGGGNVGLMGVIADAALEAGGHVTGVIPFFLREREVCHESLTELVLVDSMHERKLKMAELSDGVIVLPGGYGTLDELFEMLTLAQLGKDQRPIGILNVNGFYDHLLQHIERMHRDLFLKEVHKNLILVSDNPHQLLEKMLKYEPGEVTGKWL
jgi:uncharacterized protein (TIGR00730 family)